MVPDKSDTKLLGHSVPSAIGRTLVRRQFGGLLATKHDIDTREYQLKLTSRDSSDAFS